MVEVGGEVVLVRRPVGWPVAADFVVREVPIPEVGPGQVLVRNRVMSVDPGMRLRMGGAMPYAPALEVGRPLQGGAVGEVIVSRAAEAEVGALVVHSLGWREYSVVDVDGVRVVDGGLAPVSAYLGVLGLTGATAYIGVARIAGVGPGDVVFVSGAAGAVGAVAGQIARLRGASRVIGSAGSAEKVRYLLDEAGFDAAFNYHDGPVVEQLADAAPAGIDVYFDNVGGEHLEAALEVMNEFGRVVMCGAVSQYNTADPVPGPGNLLLVMGKRLTVRGFIARDHTDLYAQFEREVRGWLAQGVLSYRETWMQGLHRAPDAFVGMLRGVNIGKMLVALD